MIEMKPAKELTGDGFWSNRENYPVWDRTLRMLYDIADMVSESEPGICASRLIVAGDTDGLMNYSAIGIQGYPLCQRCGIRLGADELKRKGKIPFYRAKGILTKMIQKKGTQNEVDAVVCIDDNYYLRLDVGTLEIDVDREQLADARGGGILPSGTGWKAVAFASLVLDGAAGYYISKDGGILNEYNGGWGSVSYNPRTKKIVVSSPIKVQTDGRKKTRNVQFLEVNRNDGSVTTFDIEGNKCNERDPHENEINLFLPD